MHQEWGWNIKNGEIYHIQIQQLAKLKSIIDNRAPKSWSWGRCATQQTWSSPIITIALVILRYWGSQVRPKKLGLFQCIHSQFSVAAQIGSASAKCTLRLQASIQNARMVLQFLLPIICLASQNEQLQLCAPGLLSILVVYSLAFGASQKGRDTEEWQKKT